MLGAERLLIDMAHAWRSCGAVAVLAEEAALVTSAVAVAAAAVAAAAETAAMSAVAGARAAAVAAEKEAKVVKVERAVGAVWVMKALLEGEETMAEKRVDGTGAWHRSPSLRISRSGTAERRRVLLPDLVLTRVLL